MSAKRNPLYAKKPGESASDHLKRLRREFPKKFGKQPGVPNKNPTRKFTAADIAAAEARGREKAKKEISAAIQPPANEEKKTVTPTPSQIGPASAPSTAAPSPAPVPPPSSIPSNNPLPAASAAQVVSESEIFSPAPAPDETKNEPSQTQTPPPNQTTGQPSASAVADAKRYAVMIWGAIVKIFCGIFGEGFQPMVLKSETGEVLYDENIEGVKVWGNWLASIGVKAFSPIIELWLFMGMYLSMRLGLIFAKFRKKKPATTATKAGEAPEPSKEPPAPPKPAETPKPPAPPTGRTPAPEAAAPAGKLEIVEMDSNEAFL